MARRAKSKQKAAKRGVVVTWALHPIRDLIQDYLDEAVILKKIAVEQDDQAFVQGAERILKTMQNARATLRLCPQNQFRDIEVKVGAQSRGVTFAKKKRPAGRNR